MFDVMETHINAKNVRSLSWNNDALIDWAAGGRRYYLDGTIQRRDVSYSYKFDAVVVSKNGEYAIIYVKNGTKGLILKNGEILREINRSFYHADAYEYPVSIVQLDNGQEVVAHCPDGYNRLEIDDLLTGKRITESSNRKPSDYFFSRLDANNNGTYLMSAGWHWQPIDHVKVFEINKALYDPSYLDGKGIVLDTWGENSSACFLGNDELIVALWNDRFADEDINSRKAENEGDDQDDENAPFNELRVFEIKTSKLVRSIRPNVVCGTLMPVGNNHIIGFYKYPKLISIETGEVIKCWPDIRSGNQMSSITWGKANIPPMAMDPDNNRFAVASDSEIVVVQISEKNE